MGEKSSPFIGFITDLIGSSMGETNLSVYSYSLLLLKDGNHDAIA